jgi:hypothetical protein
MRVGPTLILAVAAAGLWAYVQFVERPGAERRAEAESAAKKLLDFPRDSVVELELALEDGGRARLTRDAKTREWQIAEPLAALAEDSAVTGLLTGFERLESEFQLEQAPAELARYGFAEDKRVRIVPAEGEPLLVTLGIDTPVGGQRYVRLEGRRTGIFGVKKVQAEGLSTSLYKLRDKRMSALDPRDVDGVSVRAGPRLVVRAERAAEPARPVSADEKAAEPEEDAAEAAELGKPREWRLLEPVEDRGDLDRITRLAQDLYFARASAFVDAPGPLKKYGLEPPELEIELAAKEKLEQIRMGRADGKVYLQIDRRTPLYEVPERLLTGVGREPFDYRYKRVVTLSERGTRRVELLFPRDGAQYAFVRESDEEGWKLESSELRVGDPAKVDDLLFELYTLDATALLDKPERARLGLEPPQVRVTVRGADGQELAWLELGELDEKDGIAASSSQSDRIWRVKKELAEQIPLGLAAFRSAWQVTEVEETKPEPPAPPPADTKSN